MVAQQPLRRTPLFDYGKVWGGSLGLLKTMNPTLLSPGYLGLKEHAAWVDLSQRGKIRMLGEDRKRLLHAMTTNQVQKLEVGEGCYAFFLNAQGRILGDVSIFVLEDALLLDTEPEITQKLSEHLDRYIIADDVTLEDVTSSLATVAVEGPEAEQLLHRLAGAVPSKPYATIPWGNRLIARTSITGGPGFLLFVPATEKADLIAQISRAGIAEASPSEARTVRIENGRPRYGEEITERYLVQETGQLQAVNFEKGCYLGQEIVERVRSRAQIHRMLQKVEISTKEPPEPGTKLQSGTQDAGEIASAAYSPCLDKVVALAYMRVQFSEPGTPLHLAEIAATVAKS